MISLFFHAFCFFCGLIHDLVQVDGVQCPVFHDQPALYWSSKNGHVPLSSHFDSELFELHRA